MPTFPSVHHQFFSLFCRLHLSKDCGRWLSSIVYLNQLQEKSSEESSFRKWNPRCEVVQYDFVYLLQIRTTSLQENRPWFLTWLRAANVSALHFCLLIVYCKKYVYQLFFKCCLRLTSVFRFQQLS
jgi:hypothetical protein